ncbi:MAG: DUF790 family protein [Magnetococcales bacterium]|nr:DUF790 family protein [Magnetococcales bacterium]
MLTKDLIRFNRNRQSRIFPRFLNVEDKITLNLVEELSDLYITGEGQSREDLADLAQPIINAHRSPLIAKGINKLLLDRCIFREPDKDVAPFRAKVFATAAKLLESNDSKMDSLTHFRQAVGQKYEQDADELAASLHGDLPIRQPLQSFEAVIAAKLIHRYNLAQAQGLLFNSSKMSITFKEADVGKRRFFFRYLRFFRLLARVYKEKGDNYRLELDGPLSLFDQTRKYGLRMANLLPVVVLLNEWSLTATVKPEERSGTLQLDNNDGLVSHYRLTTAYVPDEFKIFAQQFKKEVVGWKIQKISPLLDLGKQELAIPDFSFRHESGQVVHLELFHRWHKGAMIRRLKHMDGLKKKVALVIGADLFLKKDPPTLKMLERSPWFKNHGLTFNAFPPVKRVVKALESFLIAAR